MMPPSTNWDEWASLHAQHIQALTEKWQLRDLIPAPHLSYAYVLLGFQEDTPIALKWVPNILNAQKESNALKALQGHGVVSLLKEDLEQGVLLLERAMPGTSIKTFFPDKDTEALDIACQVMDTLHKTAAPSQSHAKFPHVREWLKILDQDWSISQGTLIQARQWRDDLLATAGPDILLHGDLHHDNILQHNDHWIAIDPHGVIGEKAYEVCAFLRNPLPFVLDHQNLADLTYDRIQYFSKRLDISPGRLHKWHFVQCILAVCWAMEDNTDPSLFLKHAEVISSIV